MESKSEKILRRVLIGNQGKKLTVDEIIELSKQEKYSQGHWHFSKNGISKAFVNNRIVCFNNRWVDLINDVLYGLITEVIFINESLFSIKTKEESEKIAVNYTELKS